MQTGKKILLLSLAALSAALFIYLFLNVRFNVKGHFEGFYLLHDSEAGKYEFADHLFVGEGKSLIYGKDFTLFQQSIVSKYLQSHNDDRPHLHCEWNPRDGSGVVSQYFSNGTQLVTYFGRYLDGDEEVHGLFVGGGMPETVATNTNYNMNNSGMTFGDGKRWYHIWCSVNEGIGPSNSDRMLTPSKWKFLGSRVEKKSDSNVVITSSHSVAINNVPVRIDRRVNFTAGESYFTLEISITNKGTSPVTYEYNYGDEPWVGYYGTSLGDVGWVKDRLINYEEVVDSSKYSYAGIVDSGNRVIGEQPVYTNLANFIEWFGNERPVVYIANEGGNPPPPGRKIPLESNERFIGLEWERPLLPGETAKIQLAIGMAAYDPRLGVPVKPATTWK
ncbi:MAG TPA: hypothetical protein VFF53_08880 [Geobacteraceae bacterium]|nr:hypothetical protein [Geobacteraceae bacterium]